MLPADLPEQIIARFQREYPDLLSTHLIVALSGGADSVALLHVLRDPRLGLHLEAAHVHHGTRGAEADGDATFCAEMCRTLGLRMHLLRLEPGPTPDGREAAWRRARYERLLELARRTEATAVATGHHRDDVAEGVLVQLLRGTGPRGLAGIASRTPSGIIRPLLQVDRAQIADWLADRGIAWREDSTNRCLEHLRNLVRHQVLPDLERVAPGLRGHLVSLARAIAEDDLLLGEQLETRAVWIDPWHPQGGAAVDRIRDLPAALRSRWLHAQAERVGIGRVTRAQIELLGSLLDTGEPRAIGLADRWSLHLARAHLWLEPPPGRLDACHRADLTLDAGVSLRLPIPTWTLLVHTAAKTVRTGINNAAAHNATTGSEPAPAPGPWRWTPPAGAHITIRGRVPGEAQHLGAAGSYVTRVTRERLPRHLRSAWPRFWVDDKIEWIPGIWQDQPAGNRGSLVLEVVRR